MAIYQFPMRVIPNDFIGEKLVDNVWEGSKYNNKEFIKKIVEDLKYNFEYTTELLDTIQFGKEERLLIDLITDSNGLLLSIFIRVHVGNLKDSIEEINKLVSVFKKYKMSAWTGNATKIEFNFNKIIDEISKSIAFKFIQDPEGSLNELKYRNDNNF